LLLAFAAVLTLLPGSADDATAQTGPGGQLPPLQPEPRSVLTLPAPVLPPQERERLLQARDAVRVRPLPARPAARGARAAAPQTPAPGAAAAAEFHGDDGALVTLSNVRNTRADDAGGAIPGNSTLAEPVAVNEGGRIFYMGNTHQEFSLDNGATWVSVPIPIGPADAPIVCCDPDIVYDKARGVSFRSFLYTDGLFSNGVVRIFVRRDFSLADDCSYIVDPAGSLNDVLPDYPHLGLSNTHLYVTTNNVGGGVSANRSQVRRFSLDDMADCAPAAQQMYQYIWGAVGQRVFVPADGARHIMYWFMHEDADTLRIFAWPDAGEVRSFLRNVAPTEFAEDVTCRGGVNDFDWWRPGTPSREYGFRHRIAAGKDKLHMYWHGSPDGAQLQGHVRGAVFSLNESVEEGPPVIGGSPMAEPVIANQSFCWGYPVIAANARGDIGIVLAFGGNAGGLTGCTGAGCNAAQAAYSLDDEYTPGIGFGPMTPFRTFASGTHNRDDERFGDYFSIRAHQPCDLVWLATGYALSGGDTVTNVNARVLEFGRGRDTPCWTKWDK
jgi:hypothetical protein